METYTLEQARERWGELTDRVRVGETVGLAEVDGAPAAAVMLSAELFARYRAMAAAPGRPARGDR